MAALTTTRPVSQILSDDFDLFPDPLGPLPPSSKRRQSHYRPFSTLYTESPYIEIDTKPTRLKRASSVGGLQAFQTMTFFKSKKDSSSTTPQIGSPGRKVSAPLKLKAKRDDTKKPTASSSTRPLSPPSRLKTKRSMASIFTGSDATATAPISASPESVNLFSPLASGSVSAHPSTPEDPHKSVKFKETEPRPDHGPPPQTFVPMNIWAKRHNMKLHPYGSEAVYMQAYDPILLENDRYSELLLQRLSNGYPSFYDYGKKPPATALDLGCGEGHWVLFASSIWKTSQITGFDLVDIALPTFETTENVHFVQGNFIKYRLPFDDESFEHVRMANLALCVPYDQWESLLVEVRRILTRGGRLEVIDDHMTFPYGNAPVPKVNKSSPKRSSFDFDDYSDDDLDDDTLQGEGSEECSTLNSDPSVPSSFDEKHHTSLLSPSDTIRPIFRHPSLSPDPYDKPLMTDPYFAQSSDATWKQRSMASRELESLFCSMLTDPEERLLVFPWPSHFVVNFMKNVFGGDNAGKTQSFNIRLAEWDSPIGVNADFDDPEEALGNTVDVGVGAKKKNWMTIEWEKKEKKPKEKKLKEKKGQGNSAAAGGGSSSERSSSETPMPPAVKSKAARQLGLPLPADATSTANSKTASKPKKDKSPSLPHGMAPSAKSPSAKAAGVFGMSYTELVAATAKATAGQRRGLKPQGLVQSPGLVIGQATYIPLEPLELEMHACKFVHTLLGCRPALQQYVSKFVDENGKRLVDDDMFAYHMSEYEAFRRLRFGWPSDAAEPFEDDLLSEPSQMSSPNEVYQADEPIHIRSIRVFQAIKSDNSPTLAIFSPHSPPKL
ncbi:hypothetical protein GALMADRAFT_205035 [Galerina marginata CBS 339.88]|uniref:Methyltransferase domain-containing protein n=1 Tax=Galerina marginata (strain CBS 339.88) TaxID=685588 RepID=A0A067TTK0_GALM3|nr:hypothetical protein GALMADRAFT_205035 [Galerina marginata CBS 339.88]